MTTASFPSYVVRILSKLNMEGFEAYAVGGCIRDCLRGQTPEDWDLCSAARPEQVMEIFGDMALPTGLKHGTVTVLCEGKSLELTTFRKEGTYSDHRRPDKVDFVRNIRDDLARRDFTINAMAMGRQGELLDPFGGKEDLEKALIRCVGEAEERFEEDALRMFRALRFSAKLGFSLEEKTLDALRKKAPLCADLAPERMQAELCKMLLFPCADALKIMWQAGLFPRLAPQLHGELDHRLDAALHRLEQLPPMLDQRLSAFCALAEHYAGLDSEAFLRDLRCSSEEIRRCSRAAKAAQQPLPQNAPEMKRLLYRLGEDTVRCCGSAAAVLEPERPFLSPESVLASGECWNLSQLQVKGDDLLALGYKGKELGAALEQLLFHVMDHPEDNVREQLLLLL